MASFLKKQPKKSYERASESLKNLFNLKNMIMTIKRVQKCLAAWKQIRKALGVVWNFCTEL